MGRKPRHRSPGEGSVEELPSGKFRAVLPGRTRKGRTKTFGTRPEAQAWLRKHADAVRASGTLAEWAAHWFELRGGSAARTVANDRHAWTAFVAPELGPVPLAALTGDRVAKWLADLARAGKSPDQRFRGFVTLRKIVRAHPELPNGLLEKVKAPKVDRSQRRSLTPDQYRDLCRAADAVPDPWAAAAVRVSVVACCRPQELLALRREDFDPASGVLSVRRAVCPQTRTIKALKTKVSARDVPLTPAAAAAVAKLLASHDKDWLFPAKRAERLSYFTFTKRWKKLTVAAGLAGWVPYELRHTGATFLVSRGLSLAAVARRMGHADPTLVLRTYGHVLPQDQDRLTAAFADIEAGTSPHAPHAGPERPNT